MEREHEVGLLDDLLSVEVEVWKVQEQRILLRVRVLEVPDLMVRKPFGLRMDSQGLVPGNDHLPGGITPGSSLLRVHSECARLGGVADRCVRGGQQVPLGKEVGEDIVV